MTARSRANRSSSVVPMTVRRMTSSVIADIRGATGNSVPTGHPAMLSAAISVITAVWRATASRPKGASMSRRRSRCTSPSITSTELGPSRPVSMAFASPA